MSEETPSFEKENQPVAKRRRGERIQGVNVFLGVVVVLVGMGMSGVVGYVLGEDNRLKNLIPASVSNALPNSSSSLVGKDKVDFSLFWKAWGIIDDRYFGDINDGKRLNGAISGMVAGLGDPYTMYMEPSTSTIFKSDLEGQFGGIGAELTQKNGLITVVSAMEGTPSEKMGLKADDVILEVDGSKTAGMAFNDVITKIRGKVGSMVSLQIARVGKDQPFSVTLTRDTIVVKSVKTDTLGDQQEISYIKINQFGQDTVPALQEALNAAKSSNKKGVIVDLRNNPGGYLEAAVQTIGMLVPANVESTQDRLKQRVAVVEKNKKGGEEVQRATNSPILDQLPVVFLVNGGSASASEIVAGAMKDYGRAKVVGTKTFGKGSVQDLIDLGNGGSVKVTIAKWFTPLGTGIDGKGIEPDVKVELPDGETLSKNDTQAKKGLEVLRESIK